MADHCRLDIVVSGSTTQDGETLAVLKEFIAQVYPKLDWIISQNEQILAAVNEKAQQQIDTLTAQVKAITEGLVKPTEELQQRIEENK